MNSTLFGSAIVTKSPWLDAERCELAGRAVRESLQLAAGHGAVLVGDGEVLGIACGVIRDALRVGDHRHGRILTAPAPAVPAPGVRGVSGSRV